MFENEPNNVISKRIEEIKTKVNQDSDAQVPESPENEKPLTERQIVLGKLAKIRSEFENNHKF